MTNDRLLLYPFNLDDLLKKSNTDYLLVTSEPPTSVGRGTQLSYTPAVRSRKGGVTIKLDSGPTGMMLTEGRLVWRVPADFGEKEVDVILTIADASGQEVFQTFKMAIRDRLANETVAPAEVAPVPVAPNAAPPSPVPATPATKPARLSLQPAVLAQDELMIHLPSAATVVIPAAEGRLLLIHLPKERKLAVFDTALAKIVKYLPVADDEAKIAASRDKLVLLLPAANLLQRWDLASLERDLSIANPVGSLVYSLTMGANSTGPLVITTKSAPNAFESPTLLLYDPNTFKKSDYEFADGARSQFHPQYPPQVRISANGELITAWVEGLSPSGVYLWSREGKKYKGSHQHESWGALLPAPDGRSVYAHRTIATAEGKKLDTTLPGTLIPAVHGSLVLSFAGEDPLGRPFADQPAKPLRASVHLDRSSRPLFTLPELNGLTTGSTPLGQRVFFLPAAKLLVVLSNSGDQLIVHRFALDALLAKSDVDYLFIMNRNPGTALRGEEFRHTVEVKSRKGDVKFSLEAAPMGMSIDANGTIKWAVPKDFAEKEVSVILMITDKSGQEIIHSFILPMSVPPAKP
jgi:hypothetical protein